MFVIMKMYTYMNNLNNWYKNYMDVKVLSFFGKAEKRNAVKRTVFFTLKIGIGRITNKEKLSWQGQKQHYMF